MPNVYMIEGIENHYDYEPGYFVNDLSIITMKSPIIALEDSFIEYGVLAQNSFTPKSKVSHIVTHQFNPTWGGFICTSPSWLSLTSFIL